MKNKTFYINTIGCQMNVYDSQKIASGLTNLGYIETDLFETADIAIVNTCSVREKAEQKAFSFLGRLAVLKKRRPDLIIGIGGCVAQQEGRNILKRAPYVDLVFGTHAVSRIPKLIQTIEQDRYRIVDVETTEQIEEIDYEPPPQADTDVTRFITIMRGCNNYCSYCVVPYVRGRETSRLPEKIMAEIEQWVALGMREVTLLGQNVNSYGTQQGFCSFPELLAKINAIDHLVRIRFTTSHPKDLSDELVQAFKTLNKLCKHIHLPIQSGSNRILKLMNRKYTRETYLERVANLREACPEIAITSDMIVGFPGETEADFEQTLSLMKTVQFDGLFAFAYSDRPNAPAVRFKDKVSKDQKSRRLQELLNLQEAFTLAKNRDLMNKTVTILVEGKSKKHGIATSDNSTAPIQWTGRTSTNKIVNLPDVPSSRGNDWLGKLVNVKVEKALAHSLWGRPTNP